MQVSSHVPLHVRSEDTSITCRCYSYGRAGDKLIYAIIAGPEQVCQGVFSNIIQRRCLVFIDDHRVEFNDYQFCRQVTRIQPVNTKWVSMMIMSKDPAAMWQDDDAALIASLKKVTTTPFLESWVRYLRERLTGRELLAKLSGHDADGSYLAVDSEVLDEIVGDGLRSQAIRIEA